MWFAVCVVVLMWDMYLLHPALHCWSSGGKNKLCLTIVDMKMQSRLFTAYSLWLMAYGAPQTTTSYKPKAISLYFPTSGAKAIFILVKHSLKIYTDARTESCEQSTIYSPCSLNYSHWDSIYRHNRHYASDIATRVLRWHSRHNPYRK